MRQTYGIFAICGFAVAQYFLVRAINIVAMRYLILNERKKNHSQRYQRPRYRSTGAPLLHGTDGGWLRGNPRGASAAR